MSRDRSNPGSVSRPGYALEAATGQAADLLQKSLGGLGELHFELPPPGIGADLAVPCFPLAKLLRKSPIEIAVELQGGLRWPEGGLIQRTEAVSGYLNFYFEPNYFCRRVLSEVIELKDRYGSSERGTGQTVVIDFSSPNIAKPMSVGHLRSTLIGDALCRLYRFQGYRTIGINHLGDWGTQFGNLIVAYREWINEEQLSRDPIRELLRLYVEFHERAAKDPGLEEKGRYEFRRLEEGDPESRRLWEKIRILSLREFEKIYSRLGIHFDEWSGESVYRDQTASLISEAGVKGAVRESEGALIIPLEDQGIETPLVLRKRDGGSLYATRDLSAALARIKSYDPVSLIYVVGAEQKLHFQQLFAALRKLGYAQVRYQHVDFGLMSLPEGKMSTRKGRVVFLDEVIEEAVSRATKILEAKNPDLSFSERKEVASKVGIGALKYNDLSQNRIKDVTFDWDKMLSFEGDSAPYLQYTYVRAQSILRKVPGEGEGGRAKDEFFFGRPEEIRLAKFMARFPDVTRMAAESSSPHLVSDYLFRLAREFQTFYQQVPVLRSEGEPERSTRLAMVSAVAWITRQGLSLLGIEVPERM